MRKEMRSLLRKMCWCHKPNRVKQANSSPDCVHIPWTLLSTSHVLELNRLNFLLLCSTAICALLYLDCGASSAWHTPRARAPSHRGVNCHETH